MSHLKNYRGATNYFFPAKPEYRENYDKIFGRKTELGAPCPDGKHDYKGDEQGTLLTACKHCGRPLTMDSR